MLHRSQHRSPSDICGSGSWAPRQPEPSHSGLAQLAPEFWLIFWPELTPRKMRMIAKTNIGLLLLVGHHHFSGGSSPMRKRGNDFVRIPHLRFGLQKTLGFSEKWRCPIRRNNVGNRQFAPDAAFAAGITADRNTTTVGRNCQVTHNSSSGTACARAVAPSIPSIQG